MLLFWSQSVQPTWSKFSFAPNGQDSPLLFWLALLFSCSPRYPLGQTILSPASSPFSYFLGQIFPGPIPFSFSLGNWTNYSISKPSSRTIVFYVRILPSLCSSLTKNCKSNFNSDEKTSRRSLFFNRIVSPIPLKSSEAVPFFIFSIPFQFLQN